MTFMFLSQTDPQLCVIDQRHIVLQYLSCTHTSSSSSFFRPSIHFPMAVALQAPPSYLCGGGVFLQDVNHSLKTKGGFFPGKAEPVPAGEQSVYIRPRLHLRPGRQCCRKILFLRNLRSKVSGANISSMCQQQKPHKQRT